MLKNLIISKNYQKTLLIILPLLIILSSVIIGGWLIFRQQETARAATNIESIMPTGGVTAGGTRLRIFGSDFESLNSGTLTITVGDSACTNLQVDSVSQISCNTPAKSAGPASIIVSDGNFSATLTNAYTYLDRVSTNLSLFYDAEYSFDSIGQTVYDLGASDKFGYLGQNELVNNDDPVFSSNPKRFTFDGSNDLIDTTLNSNFTDSTSLEAWFRRSNNNPVSQADVGQRLITTYQQDSTTTDCAFGDVTSGFWSYGGNACSTRHALGVEGTTVQAKAYGSSVSTSGNTQFIPNSEWQQATLTYDASTFENKIYLNGVLHQTFTQQVASASAGVIKIGTFLDQTGGFFGDIAIVRVYNTPLSEADIQYNFDNEKARFGFTQNSVLVSNVPALTTFGQISTSDEQQTVSTVLNDISFVDRRSSFVSWTASISTTDFTGPSDTISAANISIDPSVSAQTVITGSGINNFNAGGGYFSGAGIPRTLFENLGANGGGEFRISPQISVDVPAYTRAGAYNGTITVSVS